VDYVETLEGSGFKFNNPQVKSTCGWRQFLPGLAAVHSFLSTRSGRVSLPGVPSHLRPYIQTPA
jgi:hypothetical protein